MGEGQARKGGLLMKLGVLTPLYQNLPFETMLDQVKEMELETVELGTGNLKKQSLY